MPVSISGDGTFAGLTSVETVDLRHPDAVAANITLGADGSVPLDAANIASGTVDTARLPALGKVLQVQYLHYTNTASVTSESYVNVSGYSLSITPQSTQSKILVVANVNCAFAPDRVGQLQLARGTTPIGNSPAGTSESFASLWDTQQNNWVYSVSFLDSPNTTSSVTYNIRARRLPGSGFGTMWFNRTSTSADRRGAGSMTLMEIGA
jgi:hypothetical protein